MVASVSGTAAASKLTLTASGLPVSSKATLVVAFVSADNKRRGLEMRAVDVDASGNAAVDLPYPNTSGTATLKVLDSAGAVVATSTGVSV